VKAPALAVAALLVLSSAACGGQESTSSGEASPAGEGGAMAPPAEDGAASDAPPASATVLTASVGTPDDPDAYVISLVDADGQEVTELPAGDYVVEVEDPSTVHNVHLLGPGVDEATTVPETTTTQWQVTLESGDYEYVCDPHPNMVGELTVT